jgi:hypothetical protein
MSVVATSRVGQPVSRTSNGFAFWDAIVKKHRLLDSPFDQAAAWPFGDAVFNIEYDVMSDMTKARQFGFHEVIETDEMLPRLFRKCQQMRFIPS